MLINAKVDVISSYFISHVQREILNPFKIIYYSNLLPDSRQMSPVNQSSLECEFFLEFPIGQN